MRLPLPVVLAFALFCCVSCKEKEQPVTKQEAMEMSAAIDSSIRYKKPMYFNSLINEKAFASKVGRLSGKKVSSDMVKGVKDGLAKSDIGKNIIDAIRNNGFYELVKHYEKDNTHHLIFRLYCEEGLNYHDFELTKRNGTVAIADIFVYVSGENLSKTIADLMTSFTDNNNHTSGELDRQIEVLTKMRTLMARHQTRDALSYYETLPPALKNQRSLRLLYIQLCSESADGSYEKAINDFRQAYPDDPNLHLMMIDIYILRKEYDDALAEVDRLDKVIDSDPFLNYLRALVYNMKDEPAEARNVLEKLYTRMPGFADGVLELIACYAITGEKEKAQKLIKEYKNNPDFDQESLQTLLYFQPSLNNDGE